MRGVHTRTGAFVLLLLLAGACGDYRTGQTRAAPRTECVPAPASVFLDELEEGPCILEASSDSQEPWTLVAHWDSNPREGTPGVGPCFYLSLATGTGAGGAGWCDLPQERLIGEWHGALADPETRLAFGPTSAGRVAGVRIEFTEGAPLTLQPKATPWAEFDYWFASFDSDATPTALIALDDQGEEISREDLPPPVPPPTPASTGTPEPPPT